MHKRPYSDTEPSNTGDKRNELGIRETTTCYDKGINSPSAWFLELGRFCGR